MNVLVGTATSVRVEFESPTGMVVPDAGSVLWSLYATDGTLLTGPTAVATTNTFVAIPVAGSYNTITTPRRFEKRNVVVTWTVGGEAFSKSVPYQIVPFLNMTAQPGDVRAVLGVNEDELFDSEIDLASAYFLIERSISTALNSTSAGQATFSAALASGTTQEMLANQAIVGQCVLELFSGIPARVGMIDKNGTMMFQRFAKIDWAPVVKQARDMVSRGTSAILNLPESNETLLVKNHPRDVITFWHGKLSWP